jgi:hypothetical protein
VTNSSFRASSEVFVGHQALSRSGTISRWPRPFDSHCTRWASSLAPTSTGWRVSTEKVRCAAIASSNTELASTADADEVRAGNRSCAPHPPIPPTISKATAAAMRATCRWC